MEPEVAKCVCLYEAVERGRLQEVEERLETGEDITTALHMAARKSNVKAVELLLQYNPDLKKVDSNGNTALHQAESTEVAELLLKAGVEVNTQNKLGRSALEKSVATDNMDLVKVLVAAGANIDDSLKLARAEGNEKMIAFLESKTGESAYSVEDEKADLLRRLNELLEKEAEEIEIKRTEKKKLLDKMKTNLRNQSEKMEEEIAQVDKKVQDLKAELTRFKKEEENKIKALSLEVTDLGFEFDRKMVGKVKAEDVAKCLECPVCLDLCKPPREIWQCPEGHIMCDCCANRPEMRNCSQCRVALHHENLSRNRALEELARKTFPVVQAENSGHRRGQVRSGPTRGRLVTRRHEQVDRLLNFNHFDGSVMDLEEWSQDRGYPFLEDGNDGDLASPTNDIWVDLEDEEEEEDGRSGVISPTRSNSSYTYYNARLRPQVQLLSGRVRPQQPQHSRPRRGQRRRSPQYQAQYHHHHQPQRPPYYRGRGQGGGRHREAWDVWSPV